MLVSGTTGAVGANILGVFAQSPRVETVYAISRPSKSGPDVVERHARALVREGYSTDLLASGKVQMIEGDLHLEEFGLKHELYETVSYLYLDSNLNSAVFRAKITAPSSSTQSRILFTMAGRSTSTSPYLTSDRIFSAYASLLISVYGLACIPEVQLS